MDMSLEIKTLDFTQRYTTRWDQQIDEINKLINWISSNKWVQIKIVEGHQLASGSLIFHIRILRTEKELSKQIEKKKTMRKINITLEAEQSL